MWRPQTGHLPGTEAMFKESRNHALRPLVAICVLINLVAVGGCATTSASNITDAPDLTPRPVATTAVNASVLAPAPTPTSVLRPMPTRPPLRSRTTQPSVSITTASLPSGKESTAYSASLAASGGMTPYVWSLVNGSLPKGLALSAAGAISGTTAAPGTFNFTVQVRDSSSPRLTAQHAYSVAISPVILPPPLTIVTSGLPAATVDNYYRTTLQPDKGVTPYTWSVNGGRLPPGLFLAAEEGLITGTPTQAGNFDFTLRLRDSSAPALIAERPLSLLVRPYVMPTIGPRPNVMTESASHYTGTGARLNGSLTYLGLETSVQVSFRWGTEPGRYPDETASQTMTAPGAFYFDLTGLTPGTLYFYRAKYSTTYDGWGDEMRFAGTGP